jgi:uncharacterized protein (DUF305 family)
MRRLTALAALCALALTGCGSSTDPAGPPSTAAAAPSSAGPDAAANDTDVMFLQMSLEHIRQGDELAALAEQRAADPRVRALAAELRAQWRTEAATMRDWLTRWGRPVAADPDAAAHAGHGDLHSLRPADLAELRAAEGAAFDRTALSLLLGHLHNGMETARMETAGGSHPPAISLAATMTTTRQQQIRTMLTLLA